MYKKNYLKKRSGDASIFIPIITFCGHQCCITYITNEYFISDKNMLHVLKYFKMIHFSVVRNKPIYLKKYPKNQGKVTITIHTFIIMYWKLETRL